MDSIIQTYNRLISSRGDERKKLMREYLFEVSHSNATFRIVDSCPAGEENEFCVVLEPESYYEEEGCEPGFLAKNLSDDEYFQVVYELTEGQRRISREYEFPILNWEEFINRFVPVESSGIKAEPVLPKVRNGLIDTRSKSRSASEYHPFMTLCAFACAFAGIVMISAESQQIENGAVLQFIGVALLLLFAAGLVSSRCWTRVERLRGGMKALALASSIVGGIIGGLVVLALAAAWLVSRSSRRTEKSWSGDDRAF
jgi:hypothetical protein